jgi:two-component system chemotaxis response regulator CheY
MSIMSALPVPILIADANIHTRRLFQNELRLEGFTNVTTVGTAQELIERTQELKPTIVIISAELPEAPAAAFTKMIRAGCGAISRTTAIIATIRQATPDLINTLRLAGVDEILAQPFSAANLLARIESVTLRPRRFIQSPSYKGPCRRRRMLEHYGGPLRRDADAQAVAKPWEAEANRELVRRCVAQMNMLLASGDGIDRAKVDAIYLAARDAEQLADDIEDNTLASATRSLCRYMRWAAAGGQADPNVISTHTGAFQTLTSLGFARENDRKVVVGSLVAMVDKVAGPARTATPASA